MNKNVDRQKVNKAKKLDYELYFKNQIYIEYSTCQQ